MKHTPGSPPIYLTHVGPLQLNSIIREMISKVDICGKTKISKVYPIESKTVLMVVRRMKSGF